MWLRRLVAIVMVITCVGLNVLTLLGIVLPDKTKQAAATAQQTALVQATNATLPTITFSASPTTIAAGATSALSWSTTGNPTACTASGSWNGDKTPFGSESTGRIANSGNYTYTLSCSNAAGKTEASTIVTVGNAPAPARSTTTTSTPSQTASYCGGRLPCYGPHDLSAHASSGNCWGWNGDRVINISGFDAAFHITQSGISTIQISQICGHDLAPALNGQVTADGQTRVHNQSTKNNADANEIPYFVGYFDASKP